MPVVLDFRWVIWPLAVYGALVLASMFLSSLWRGLRRTGQRPFLSVLLVVRNKERVIEGLIRGLSALNTSTHPENHEIVVVDDHSDDQTGAILDRLTHYHPGMRAVHLADLGSNKGSPVEIGLFMCQSPVVLLLNLEGKVHPRLLLQAAAFFLSPRPGEVSTTGPGGPTVTRMPHASDFQGKERAGRTSN